MSASTQPAEPFRRSDVSEPDFTLADIIDESMLLLGAGSTVLYQLALLGVGRGVAEHSTTLARPLDRLRTTLTYVYVMTLGTQQERDAVAEMVNRMHGPVRGDGYTAFDRDLQLWVAATLAHNGIFIHEKAHGPMSHATKQQIYRDSQVFGTALQVREEDWPATYADFEKYWDHTIATQLTSEPLVRDYVRALLSTKGQPLPLKPAVGLQNLMTAGNLPPEVRDVLGLSWSWRRQKLYDLFWSVHNLVYPVLPAFVRKEHARLVLRDFRRRMRKGRRVI
ncbi:MAG: hypothetical protein JWR85_633 [Marmoricola sp.]|nr:hypothetical protein [Marmoricola sp.]